VSLAALRRLLTFHPRAVLVVLLALAIELVPPPSLVVRHRHAGGGTAHVHAGPVAGVVRDAPGDDAIRTPLAGPGLVSAGASALHTHLAPPAVVAALPSVVPPAPALVVSPLPLAVSLPAPVLVSRATRARAPPLRVA